MQLHDRSLTVQFYILLVIGLLLLGGSGTYGLLQLSGILATYDRALNEQVANEGQILIIQNDFKKQVQEWKNVLLRGHDPQNLDKYWGKFEQKEQAIGVKIKQLLPHLSNSQAKSLLQSFLTSHHAMGQAYREGLKQYQLAGFDPKVGDKVVKGIDRAPTEQLGEAAALIAAEVELKTAQLKAQSHTILLYTSLLWISSAIIFIFLGGLLVKRQIIKPTQKISACLSRFAEGDFSANDLQVFDGELGDVAKCASHVKRHLGEIIQDVRNTAQQLSQAANTLNSTTHETQNDLQHQQADIQQVATAMDQMSAVVTQVTENTRAAADAADQAKAASLNGRGEVEKSITEINGLAKDVEKASQVIQQLESDVSNIATVLDVIRSIAEQTNLLALNAAIEAARAGEQGRGFAVVADEVRTLAGRTQESTSEIQEMIEKLESGATKAVEVMHNSHQQADRSVEQSAAAGASIDTIAQAVSAMNEMNQQIAISTKEQATVTEDIHQNITRINDLSQHTSDSARLMAESGKAVAKLADNMDQLVKRFKI